MITLKKKLVSAAGLLLIATVVSSPAAARCSSGFLANALCKAGVIDKRTANAADGVHHNLGKPLDRAAPVIANKIVPGSGTAFMAMQQLRRHHNTRRFRPVAPRFRRPVRPVFTHKCATPFGIAFTRPGPVGAPCFVPTYRGQLPGRLVF